MKIKDFENARREGMEFEGMHTTNGDVVSVHGFVAGDGDEVIHGVWNNTGRFFAFLHQPENDDDNLVREVGMSAAGVYFHWNGCLVIRTPWFDLKFE